MPNISAPPYKVQLFFKDKDGSGWSEDWWIDAASYQAALDRWDLNVLSNNLENRLALMTSAISCVYVRVSDSTIKRDTIIRAYDLTTGAGTYAPDAGDSLPADDAVLLRLQGFNDAAPVFTLKPLRGLPEECVTDGDFTPTATWTNAFQTFETALRTDGRMVLKGGAGVLSTNIDSTQLLHMTQRKTGRPFGQSRGRSMRP